jgi:hypothetical protein
VEVLVFDFEVVLFEEHFGFDFDEHSKHLVDIDAKTSQALLISILHVNQIEFDFFPDVVLGGSDVNYDSVDLDQFGFFEFLRTVHFVNGASSATILFTDM